MTNFQINTDTLPKDKSGYPQLGGIDLSKRTHTYSYLSGIGGGDKTDDAQAIDVQHLGVFPADTWSIVAAGTYTAVDDLAAAIIAEDMSTMPDWTAAIVWLYAKTYTGRVLPDAASGLTGMFLEEGREWEMKMTVENLTTLAIKNEVAGENVIIEYAVFAMPVYTV